MNRPAQLPWIVVLTWNGQDRLAFSLGALAAMRGEFEVLVVDNGSSDGSAEEARRVLPRAHLLRNETNLGFAEGNNRGLARALECGATHVGILNDDLAVHPEWLLHLLADAREHPAAGIWGGLVLFQGRRDTVNSTGLVADRLLRVRDRDFGRPLAELKLPAAESVPAVTGGAMLISRAVLERVGLFDAGLFAYYEDYDLCLRARRQGFEVRFVPQAVSYHQFAASLGPEHPLRRYLLSRNQMIMVGRHAPSPAPWVLLPALAVLRLCAQSPLLLLRGRPALARAEARAALHGLARGWRELGTRRQRRRRPDTTRGAGEAGSSGPITEPGAAVDSLLAGRRLARNAAWNLAGLGLPLVAGLVAIPFLVAGLGTARFGVLTLAWMVSGYFSLFDLGLGRAVTKLVAERLGRGSGPTVAALAWTALGLMTAAGLAATPLVLALSAWLVHHVLHIPAELRGESLRAFSWMAVSLPFVISTTGLRALLEAHQRFGRINAVRVPMGVLNFLGPLAVLPFSRDLGALCAVLTAGRAVAWLVHLGLCRGILGPRPVLQRHLVRPLLGLGGWMTVSGVLGPVMVYLDRFLIGAVLSVTVVAYYTTPFEVVSKLLIIPAALAGVLFPALSTTWAATPGDAERLLVRGSRHLFLLLLPLVLVIMTLAREGLRLWLGPEFAANSSRILQWLAAGVLVNGLAHLPLALLHGAGRPDLSAKAHLAELALYLPALWWSLGRWGVEGAAIVWTLRAAVDAAVLFALARRLLPSAAPSEATRRRPGFAAAFAIGAALALPAGALLPGTAARLLFLAAALPTFVVGAWRWLLGPDERAEIRRLLRGGPRRAGPSGALP